MKRYLLLAATLLLSACLGGGAPINDYSNRSVVYGWLDVSEIQGNHLFSAQIRQYRPATDKPFYGMAIEKYAGGYLIYHYGVAPGLVELDKLALQSCLAIMCSNTINEYNFSAYGDSPGQVNTSRPGVHYMGAFKLKKERGGLFRMGEFSVSKVSGPSKAGMLNVILKDAPSDHPVVAQRIRSAM